MFLCLLLLVDGLILAKDEQFWTIGQQQLEVKLIINKTNDVSSLLIHTHKEISLARKLNVKPLLQSSLHGLCTKKHMTSSSPTSNRFLYEEDLGDEVDKSFKKRKVVQKV